MLENWLKRSDSVGGQKSAVRSQKSTIDSQQSTVDNQTSTIDNRQSTIDNISIPHTSKIKVSELLEKLTGFKENYFEKGVIPNLNDPFDRNLFNTFLCYIDHATFFPFMLKKNTDERGSFVETVKLNSGGQVSFSTTKPGITRGNHFHTRKAERFAVIKGKARIQLERSERIRSYHLISMVSILPLSICRYGIRITSPIPVKMICIRYSGSMSFTILLILILFLKKFKLNGTRMTRMQRIFTDILYINDNFFFEVCRHKIIREF